MSEAGLLPPGVEVFERGWLSANNILFTSPSGTAMVDSGYCTQSAQTVALVERALADRPLDLLLNTHLHGDHCGGNQALQERYPELETRIPPGSAVAVRNWNLESLGFELIGQRCPRFHSDGLLAPGSELDLGDRKWQVHAAPGHDPHSIVLFEPASSTLISADALWENGFGVVFQELEGNEAFNEVSATLDMIESMNVRTVIPGHGKIFRSVGAALAAARRRLESFARSPHRHASHAAKVLLKFKLLEVQRIQAHDVLKWARHTPYFGLMHSSWFNDMPMEDWLKDLIEDLIHSGALAREGEWVLNA